MILEFCNQRRETLLVLLAQGTVVCSANKVSERMGFSNRQSEDVRARQWLADKLIGTSHLPCSLPHHLNHNRTLCMVA
jgi:hypothetical protein